MPIILRTIIKRSEFVNVVNRLDKNSLIYNECEHSINCYEAKEQKMEDFFIIPEIKLEQAWNPPDRTLELFVLDYCEEVLNIPLFLVADAACTNEGIEIELRNLEDWMIGEDWYINLFRLSYYAKAS